jgi:fido (protein-threonine AMPylation protein)
MDKSFRRPKNKSELDDREVAGLWKAIALTHEIGESNERITLDTVLRIHKVVFVAVAPEMAGRFRRDGEDVKKLKCIEPPPGRVVQERAYSFWRELDARLSIIPRHPKKMTITQVKKWRSLVFDVATWAQHQIASIHPFCEGNGRMARLMTNLILSRYGLPPSQVKYEKKEDKERYLSALCQIDLHGNYEPLKESILKSVYEAYKKEQKLRQRSGSI